MTDRYKLIYSTKDDPWLFDLEQDPDELSNCFTDPEYRETVQELSQRLAEYGLELLRDPRSPNLRIQADLGWAIDGEGPYVAPKNVRRSTFRYSCPTPPCVFTDNPTLTFGR